MKKKTQEKFDFWRKFLFLAKPQFLIKIVLLLTKIFGEKFILQIFDENFWRKIHFANFWRKFLAKNSFFAEKSNFWQKIQLLTKNSIFHQKLYFWPRTIFEKIEYIFETFFPVFRSFLITNLLYFSKFSIFSKKNWKKFANSHFLNLFYFS